MHNANCVNIFNPVMYYEQLLSYSTGPIISVNCTFESAIKIQSISP